jgi:hypothetical protein
VRKHWSKRARWFGRKNAPDPFCWIFVVAVFVTGCGKRGSPLPPIVRLPTAPPSLLANRRAETVDVQLTIPGANTDGSRPANISRVDVYAVTAAPAISDAELLKRGTKIASLRVKTPRDPDDAVEADEEGTDVVAPEGPGLEQGASAQVVEDLAKLVPEKSAPPLPSRTAARGPLVGTPAAVPSRTYAAVAFNNRGRRGPISKRVAVPLVAAPPRVSQPDISYDEAGVSLTWRPVGPPSPPSAEELLPSHPLVATMDAGFAYNVYDVSVSPKETKLTASPVADPKFVDARMEWGAERCYVVRTAETVGGLSVEGDASPPRCVTPVDTFPPAAPKGLQSAPSEGAVNLIWDANTEKDLVGYLVLRGDSAQTLMRITAVPVQAPTFKDAVPPGFHAFYAVEAVDTAGNISPLSMVMEETAR